jgi:hypothetical protein
MKRLEVGIRTPGLQQTTHSVVFTELDESKTNGLTNESQSSI